MSYFAALTETGDLLQDAVVLTMGAGEASGFPFTNVATSDITELWVSPPLAASLDYLMTIDLDASVHSWNTFVIGNHNFNSTMVVQIKSGSTLSYTEHPYETLTWREGDMFFYTATTRTDRYIQLRFTDASSALNFAMSIGRVMMGLSFVPTRPFNQNWMRTPITHTRSSRGELGTKSVDVLYKCNQYALDFAHLLDADATLLTNFLDDLNGEQYYFFLIPDTSVYEGDFVNLVNQPGHRLNKHAGAIRRTTYDTAQFEQVSRGVRLGA